MSNNKDNIDLLKPLNHNRTGDHCSDALHALTRQAEQALKTPKDSQDEVKPVEPKKMTDYEAQSLQIATDTYHVYFWGDIIAAGALVAAIIGSFFAFFTLRKIAQQLESAKWNALLAFEQDMNARRQRFSDMAQKVIPESKEKHELIHEEAKESYLNAVERLASSILKGQFPESEMKTSYREHIASTIREYEDKFRAGTHYPRILELHQKWRD